MRMKNWKPGESLAKIINHLCVRQPPEYERLVGAPDEARAPNTKSLALARFVCHCIVHTSAPSVALCSEVR